MGSTGSPKSSTPYDAYRDCALGICNIYCSQWCNYPPPLDTGDDSGTSFSPLIIAVIGILASAILLVCYYAIITKYCRRRRGFIWRNHHRRQHHHTVESELHLDQLNNLNEDQWQVNSNGGLDEGLIKSITVFQYKKGVGLVEGTECSVCLNEFQENENLRLLPKCCHAFHPPCIDIWLKSHSNCPLCRANVAPIPPPLPLPLPPAASGSSQSSSTLNISAMETQRPNDLVFVIDQEELFDNQEVCVNGFSDLENLAIIRTKKTLDPDGSRDLRRTRNGLILVADVLQMNEDDDEEIKIQIQHKLEMKIMCSSKRVQEQEESK